MPVCIDCGVCVSKMSKRGRCARCHAIAKTGSVDHFAAMDGSARLLAAMQGYFARHHGVGR